ncbi:ATP-binding cassette transporter, putative [Ricinus communis]|uniref:ATP-binding cassette transporter, putative n=1 Tax=Ricinus communis TaxID=3988 RepID=B9SMW4_RICCO|nr:ATP-binding cassette transporter, putative [Ricinus communis]
MVTATSLGSLILLLMFTSGGYVLSRDKKKKWWKWAYWVSPMMYGQNAITINEFLGKSWSHVLPNSTEPLGVQVLKSRAAYWYWIGVGALIGFTLLFYFCYTMALTFLGPLEKPQTIIHEECSEPGGRTGGSIHLACHGEDYQMNAGSRGRISKSSSCTKIKATTTIYEVNDFITLKE